MTLSNSATLTLAAPKTWHWQGFPITYQSCGEQGAAVLLIHGFGASWGHWRKNLPVLGESYRCYAIDLIGFGGSAKPIPGEEIAYTFETWGQLVADFCREVIGESAFLVGNSIGCIVAMQAGVDAPEMVRGIAAINCSLRLLHERKQAELPWYRSAGAGMMQNLLSNKAIGQFFFNQIAKPKVVKNILLKAYRRPDAVNDELIEILMTPAKEAGAAEVFCAFTRYSQGPLPEDLLPLLSCPVSLLWGTADPWEPVAMGEELAKIETVDEFIALDGLGHCPQDEAPDVVNPVLLRWLAGLLA